MSTDRRPGRNQPARETGPRHTGGISGTATKADRHTVVGLIIALIVLSAAGSLALSHAPRYCTLDRQPLDVAKEEPVLRFAAGGREQTLLLLSDRAGQPLMYFADVTIDVCLDEVCEPVRIELYWDLLGSYAGYGVVSGFPLLKYEHQPFQPGDYLKLHEILSDQDSILGKQPLAAMVVPGVARKDRTPAVKEQVDVVSGATTKDIRNAVVAGALYSCHALWNLVHGELRLKIRRHLASIFTPDLARRFLHSDSPAYQAHALENMDAASIGEQLPRVLELFGDSGPVLRGRFLGKLPPSAWRDENVARTLFSPFAKLDSETRSALIRNLEQAHPVALEVLTENIERMTKGQLQGYLAALDAEPSRLTGPIRSRLRGLAAAERYAYCYVIADFLRQRSKGPL